MKIYFVLAIVIFVSFLAAPNTVDCQKGNAAIPTESSVSPYLRSRVTSESGGALSLASFRKTNGYEQGNGLYVIEWQAEILFQQECWKPGDMFSGYWQDFSVMLRQPQGLESVIVGVGTANHYEKGTTIRLTGNSTLRKTEKGWRLEGFSVKTYQVTVSPTNDYASHYSKAIAYDTQGKYNLAIAEYTKAIQINPKDDAIFIRRAQAYDKQGKYDLAIADYSKAIQIDSKDFMTFNYRGFTYFTQGKYNLAIADFTKANEIYSKDFVSNVYLGFAYDKQGKYSLAIAAYTKAIEMIPEEPFIYLARADSFCKSVQKYLAFADEKKAAELGAVLDEKKQKKLSGKLVKKCQ